MTIIDAYRLETLIKLKTKAQTRTRKHFVKQLGGEAGFKLVALEHIKYRKVADGPLERLDLAPTSTTIRSRATNGSLGTNFPS